MRARHRIPTVFSIYMLDVICCALGCVILLWQVNREALDEQTEALKAQEVAARAAEEGYRQATLRVDSFSTEVVRLTKELEGAKVRLESISQELAGATKDRDEARRLVLLREKEYQQLAAAMQLSEVLVKNLRAELEKSKDDQKRTALELADRINKNAELLLRASAAESKLAKETKARKIDAAEAARRLQEQLDRLASMEKRQKSLETDLQRTRLDSASGDEKLRGMIVAHDRLAKQLGEAKAIISSLDGERLRLVDHAAAVQAEAERRFAGITLSGQRVIFLIDMSGSMRHIDRKTEDPTKWPQVCETVRKLQSSIAGLKQYQVILFSDGVRYPLGNEGRWLSFTPGESPTQVFDTLVKVVPEGETNLHAGFTAAFSYMDRGLDTIYLVSDGLPTAGEGLPAGADQLTEAQKSDILTQHLRAKLKNEWNPKVGSERRVRINAIGYFFESPDVGAFLWAMSREHDGSFVGMSRP